MATVDRFGRQGYAFIANPAGVNVTWREEQTTKNMPMCSVQSTTAQAHATNVNDQQRAD
jgi:hypothetical protein